MFSRRAKEAYGLHPAPHYVFFFYKTYTTQKEGKNYLTSYFKYVSKNIETFINK